MALFSASAVRHVRRWRCLVVGIVLTNHRVLHWQLWITSRLVRRRTDNLSTTVGRLQTITLILSQKPTKLIVTHLFHSTAEQTTTSFQKKHRHLIHLGTWIDKQALCFFAQNVTACRATHRQNLIQWLSKKVTYRHKCPITHIITISRQKARELTHEEVGLQATTENWQRRCGRDTARQSSRYKQRWSKKFDHRRLTATHGRQAEAK